MLRKYASDKLIPVVGKAATYKETRRQKVLLKLGALQKAILNSTNFSSIATDERGVIQIFNICAERMLGYGANEVLNLVSLVDIVDPDEMSARANALSAESKTLVRPAFEALVFKATQGIEDIYELTYIGKDGSRFPAIVSVTALQDAANTIIGYLLIGTDNTARKQVEAERKQVETELQLAKAAAEKANLAKSDFLSSMSHELRTPLSAILGFAQLMETSSPSPTFLQKRSIDQILKAGWYLLDLINEILDLALVESGRMSLSLESIELAKVLRECRAMTEPQAVKCSISVSFPELEIPYCIRADRTRLKQVIINLLSNAIKYNRAGGKVEVRCSLGAAERVRISIEDTGEGLSPQQLTQLFQPFNRLGQEAKAVEGTGIGLVMAKRLAELMGGVIGVESTVGTGSVFWIELPVALAPQSTASLSAPIAAPTTNSTAALRTLLYVEDNPANLMLMEDVMKPRPDIRLLTASDGLAGIAMARAVMPDVILLDLNLPGISGFRVLELLLADPATAGIPVIALSANAMPRDVERGLAAGFFRYLTKPIRIDHFLETLEVAMQVAMNGPATN